MVQYRAKHASGIVEYRYGDELDALVNRFAVFVRNMKSQDKSHTRWKLADMGTPAEIEQVAQQFTKRGWEADVVGVETIGWDEETWKSLHDRLHEEPTDSQAYQRLMSLNARRMK